MLRKVPIGTSRFGCGTVTLPDFTGCLNCLWLPTWFTSYQPSASRSRIISRLCIFYTTHFLHIAQDYRLKSVLPNLCQQPRKLTHSHHRRNRVNLLCQWPVIHELLRFRPYQI